MGVNPRRTITQTYSLPLDVAERLEALAVENGKTRSGLIREAIILLLESYGRAEGITKNLQGRAPTFAQLANDDSHS